MHDAKERKQRDGKRVGSHFRHRYCIDSECTGLVQYSTQQKCIRNILFSGLGLGTQSSCQSSTSCQLGPGPDLDLASGIGSRPLAPCRFRTSIWTWSVSSSGACRRALWRQTKSRIHPERNPLFLLPISSIVHLPLARSLTSPSGIHPYLRALDSIDPSREPRSNSQRNRVSLPCL